MSHGASVKNINAKHQLHDGAKSRSVILGIFRVNMDFALLCALMCMNKCQILYKNVFIKSYTFCRCHSEVVVEVIYL